MFGTVRDVLVQKAKFIFDDLLRPASLLRLATEL